MYYLYGAGGHAKVIIEILELAGEQVAAIYDEDVQKDELLHYPVFHDIPHSVAKSGDLWIISIGSGIIRKKAVQNVAVRFGNAFHASARISSRASIGEGTVVMAGAVINSCCDIGNHVIINTNSSVDHDCRLGDFVNISPNAALAGKVEVSEGTHIGMGACIIPAIKIGAWCTIGAGAVIIRDVPDYAVVVGNPGKIIKYNKNSFVKSETGKVSDQ